MHRTICALVTGALAIAAAGDASAQATVSGSLSFERGKRPSPPERSRGYVKRMPHPLMADKPVETPYPAMFVFLTGGDAGDDASEPERRPPEIHIIGQRFSRLVYPVLVGQTVVLKNVSTKSSNRGVTPRIDAPGHRNVFASPSDAGNPLNPNGERELKVAKAMAPVVLQAIGTPHLRSTLVGLPTKYFAAADDSGRFAIDGVPQGTWTARVWYDNGWLKFPDGEPKIEVPARGKTTVKITIPPAMAVAPVAP